MMMLHATKTSCTTQHYATKSHIEDFRLTQQSLTVIFLCECTPKSFKYCVVPLSQSVSLKYPNEQRPTPVPKPRRRPGMLASSKSTDKLDDFSSDANSLTNSCPEPPRALHRRPNISISVSSLPALMTEEGGEATYLQLDEVAMVKDEQKNRLRSGGKSCSVSAINKQRSSYENPDDPIYVKFPVTEPPTPPPRDQPFRFSDLSAKRATSLYSNRSQDQRALRPNRLSVIDEKDESVKSPQGLMTPRNQRTTQSMKSPRVRSDSLLLEPDPFLRRPSFDRQRSRGDILISEVVTSVKAKVRRSQKCEVYGWDTFRSAFLYNIGSKKISPPEKMCEKDSRYRGYECCTTDAHVH